MELHAETRIGFTTKVEVTHFIGDLEQDKYIFEYNERNHKLYFKRYMNLTRKTKRHSWRAVKIFGALDRRQNTMIEPPLVPQKVTMEAVKEFRASLKY